MSNRLGYIDLVCDECGFTRENNTDNSNEGWNYITIRPLKLNSLHVVKDFVYLCPECSKIVLGKYKINV